MVRIVRRPGADRATAPRAHGRVLIDGLRVDNVRQAEAVCVIFESLGRGVGGWVVTPNVDILRLARHVPEVRALLSQATITVADGAPLLWAARLRGTPLKERVPGADLIFSISQEAARTQRSIYLLGGEPGVPELAGTRLRSQFPGLKVAGTLSPQYGFDRDPVLVSEVRRQVSTSGADIVFVGLGCPKQERLIESMRAELPNAWFFGCGAAIAFAAGAVPRSPSWMQRTGLEWLHRLAVEPRRLARRYLVYDVPYAIRLLSEAAISRLSERELGVPLESVIDLRDSSGLSLDVLRSPSPVINASGTDRATSAHL